MMKPRIKGFQISLDKKSNILKIRTWGLWDIEFAQKFEKELKEKSKEINGSKKEWYMLMDLTESLTPSQEVHNIMHAGLASLDGQRIRKRAILASWSIALFQTLRRVQDTNSPVYSYFRSENEAFRWLLNETNLRK